MYALRREGIFRRSRERAKSASGGGKADLAMSLALCDITVAHGEKNAKRKLNHLSVIYFPQCDLESLIIKCVGAVARLMVMLRAAIKGVFVADNKEGGANFCPLFDIPQRDGGLEALGICDHPLNQG